MAGEKPAWVAEVLGHTDLSMVYTVYGKFIPDNNNDGNRFNDVTVHRP